MNRFDTLEQAEVALNEFTAKLKEADMTIAYLHGHGDKTITLDGLAVHGVAGFYEIVALFDSSYFSVNPVLTLKDGSLAVSKWATGGTFFNRGDMEKDVQEYNNSLTFGGGILLYWTTEMDSVGKADAGKGLI